MTATGNRIAEFNGLDKDIEKFFKIISFIDDSSHEPVMYQWVAGSKFRIINKTGKDYIFGKPRWKRIR